MVGATRMEKLGSAGKPSPPPAPAEQRTGPQPEHEDGHDDRHRLQIDAEQGIQHPLPGDLIDQRGRPGGEEQPEQDCAPDTPQVTCRLLAHRSRFFSFQGKPPSGAFRSAHHSILVPDALITSAHFAISAFMNRLNSSGVLTHGSRATFNTRSPLTTPVTGPLRLGPDPHASPPFL